MSSSVLTLVIDRLAHQTNSAFNAGLVIFAAIHVARYDVQSDPKRLSRWEFVEKAMPYFNMAIEALRNLDQGNRVVERCVDYLSQLTLLPIDSCESQSNFHYPLSTFSSSNWS